MVNDASCSPVTSLIVTRVPAGTVPPKVSASEAWVEPEQQDSPGELPPCSGMGLSLQEALEQGPIQVHTNLPDVIRVSANGLLLDGGTTVISHERVARSLCLVVSLPLGVSRVGIYQGALPALGEAPRSTLCRPRIQEG